MIGDVTSVGDLAIEGQIAGLAPSSCPDNFGLD
jgi:hypothetical protein